MPLPASSVLLCNLGTPAAPTPQAVRSYLAEFLADPRVVEIPRIAWLPLLYGVILPLRASKSAAKYASIWMPEGSPLKVYTERQAAALQARLGERTTVRAAMRYGEPALARQLDAAAQAGQRRILVVSAYPQYSGTTTASLVDAVNAWCGRQRWIPELRFLNSYPDDPGYIAALAASAERVWAREGRPDHLVMSFHGVPERTVQLGDPYEAECRTTARLLAQRLGLADTDWTLAFQSRFGKAKWLEPATTTTLQALGQRGVRRTDVICPGFTSDCLETLEEISIEGRADFIASGGSDFRYIPCLNDDPAWIDALTALAERHLAGWD